MSSTLFVFDYDGTLVHENDRTEHLDVLDDLKEHGFELAIASRNHMFYVERGLETHSIKDLFSFIMADFRPKSIQIRHILFEYEKRGISIEKVCFIDDHAPNIERVRKDLPEVQAYLFGSDIHSLSDLFTMYIL